MDRRSEGLSVNSALAEAVAPAGPVRQSERISSVDVLRGFALLGILVMNIGDFALHDVVRTTVSTSPNKQRNHRGNRNRQIGSGRAQSESERHQ